MKNLSLQISSLVADHVYESPESEVNAIEVANILLGVYPQIIKNDMETFEDFLGHLFEVIGHASHVQNQEIERIFIEHNKHLSMIWKGIVALDGDDDFTVIVNYHIGTAKTPYK